MPLPSGQRSGDAGRLDAVRRYAEQSLVRALEEERRDARERGCPAPTEIEERGTDVLISARWVIDLCDARNA